MAGALQIGLHAQSIISGGSDKVQARNETRALVRRLHAILSVSRHRRDPPCAASKLEITDGEPRNRVIVGLRGSGHAA